MRLRDGSTTGDHRLDRLVQFDERSRAYPVLEAVDATKPRSRTWAVGAKLDQGREGACVGFAVAHDLTVVPRLRGWRRTVTDAFARDLYHSAQRIDPWPGGEYAGASPRYAGTSLLAGLKAARDAGHIDAYRWAFGEDELALAVSHVGSAVIGVNWYAGMFEPDAKGYVHPSGRVVGGHAICVSGISVHFDRYRLHNSWGPRWGRNGWCYISRDDMARLLREDGEAAVPLRSRRV